MPTTTVYHPYIFTGLLNVRQNNNREIDKKEANTTIIKACKEAYRSMPVSTINGSKRTWKESLTNHKNILSLGT
jgi:hypothetical protein